MLFVDRKYQSIIVPGRYSALIIDRGKVFP